jgi:ketosteroid isomerase-like protein
MKILKSFLVLCLISFNCFSQKQTQDSLAIRAILVDFFEVFTNPDMKHYDRNCAAEFSLLENGEVWARPEIEKYVNNVLSKPKEWTRTNEFNFLQFNIKGNFAWVNYKNTATIKGNSATAQERKMNWLESIILEKQNGKWKLLQMHSTVAK